MSEIFDPLQRKAIPDARKSQGAPIRIAILAPLLAALLVACAPRIQQQGNVPDAEQVVLIQPGIDDKNRVAELLGSPSTTSTFDADTWYYISRRTSQDAFWEPEVLDQSVLAIAFDTNGLVEDMKIYDQDDGRLVAMVDRTTPVYGNELTLFQQLLGNLGRFNTPKKTRNPGDTSNPGGGY